LFSTIREVCVTRMEKLLWGKRGTRHKCETKLGRRRRSSSLGGGGTRRRIIYPVRRGLNRERQDLGCTLRKRQEKKKEKKKRKL